MVEKQENYQRPIPTKRCFDFCHGFVLFSAGSATNRNHESGTTTTSILLTEYKDRPMETESLD